MKNSISPKLNQIATVCGRFKRIAWRQQKARVKFPPDEIVSLTQGNDLARLLPSELALLSSPDTEDLFFLRYAEQALLQYDLIGHEPQGQGPIILALDESGSMNEHCGAMTKEVWSKAVMLGMLSIARWQKRDFAVIHFSGESEIRIDRFPKGLASTQEVIPCASHFFSGGTVFDEWMEAALQLINESAFEQADCVCLSDGVGDTRLTDGGRQNRSAGCVLTASSSDRKKVKKHYANSAMPSSAWTIWPKICPHWKQSSPFNFQQEVKV